MRAARLAEAAGARLWGITPDLGASSWRDAVQTVADAYRIVRSALDDVSPVRRELNVLRETARRLGALAETADTVERRRKERDRFVAGLRLAAEAASRIGRTLLLETDRKRQRWSLRQYQSERHDPVRRGLRTRGDDSTSG